MEDVGLSASEFYKVLIKPSTESKWERMKKVTTSQFGYYASEEAIRGKVGTHLDMAQLIARTKSSFDPEKLTEQLASLSVMSPEVVRNLWDNLYYQVLHHTDFYVKEATIQLLVLQNILEFRSRLQKDEFLKELPVMANARVVLPTYLFSDSGATAISTQRGVATAPLFNKGKLVDNSAVLSGKYDLQRNEKAVEELEKCQTNYKRVFIAAYDAALATYSKDVAAAYKAAVVEEKTRTDCSGCVEVYYEYKDLDLPSFDPKLPVEIDRAQLAKDLSPESYYVLELYDLLGEKTYDGMIAGIRKHDTSIAKTVYGATRETEKIISVGGMVFQARSGSDIDVFANENQIPFIVKFKTTSYLKGTIQFSLTNQYADIEVDSVSYTATVPGKNPQSGTTFSTVQGFAGIFLFPDYPNMELLNMVDPIELSMTFTLEDGTTAETSVTIPVNENAKTPGVADITNRTNNNNGNEGSTFAPSMFGIRRLGIADYKKVVAQICCYKEAEVSSIENIMQGEFKNRTTTRERIEETTVTTERQTEKENITDTAVTERFEMQSEIAKILSKQKELNAYANINGKYGPDTTFEVGGNYATATAKEESTRQAITKSKEITQSATERIVSRFREEIVTKVTERYKEENTHILDNRTGTGNVSGVYRYINAVYKNSILNYGKRLMFEFMIPQPSKLFRLGMEEDPVAPSATGVIKITAPVTLESLGIVNAGSITELNYLSFASRYGAPVEAPPPALTYVGRAYKGGDKTSGAFSVEFNDLKVPEGYRADTFSYTFTMRRQSVNLNADLMIGNVKIPMVKDPASQFGTGNITSRSSNGAIYFEDAAYSRVYYSEENIPISVNAWDLGSFSLNVNVTFKRTKELLETWQQKTYDVIIRAYKDRVAEYNDQMSSVQQEGNRMLSANPLFYRDIEAGILKKNCISYLVPSTQLGVQYYTGGDSFKDFAITRDNQMDAYASKAKFMEQAFEWNIMSYTFYPYYWGFKNDWKQLFQSENDDPLFRNFLKAGMARVIVSVTPGFEDAVTHYMNTGDVWNGSVPVIGDPLYKSIVDELKEQEYVVEETWETTLPTSLIGLQEKGVSITTVGLPCGDGCDTGDSPFKQNDNELKPPMEVKP